LLFPGNRGNGKPAKNRERPGGGGGTWPPPAPWGEPGFGAPGGPRGFSRGTPFSGGEDSTGQFPKTKKENQGGKVRNFLWRGLCHDSTLPPSSIGAFWRCRANWRGAKGGIPHLFPGRGGGKCFRGGWGGGEISPFGFLSPGISKKCAGGKGGESKRGHWIEISGGWGWPGLVIVSISLVGWAGGPLGGGGGGGAPGRGFQNAGGGTGGGGGEFGAAAVV